MGVLRPSGPLPAGVYWRRRVVVLMVAVAVVVLMVLGVRALSGSSGGGGADRSSTADPAAGASAAPSNDASGTVACRPEALAIDLASDASSYPSGAQPVFTVTLTNTGAVPCVVGSGDVMQTLTVTSGSDRIWSSADCADGDPVQLLLAPEQVDERQMSWPAERSDEACTASLPTPQAGTYQATVTVGAAASEPVVFTLQ